MTASGIPQATRWMYTALFVAGYVNYIATLQWMRHGDPTMIIAMLALAAYCAAYIPLFVGVTRFVHHRWGAPLVLAVPVVWTGLEYVRAHIGTGFAWYFLSHTQHRWLELIQISDLTGAYGVTFVVAMGNDTADKTLEELQGITTTTAAPTDSTTESSTANSTESTTA